MNDRATIASTAAPRDAVFGVRAYAAGRNASVVERELGIVGALRLASNESPFDPLPSVVEALSASARTSNRYPGVRAADLVARISTTFDVPVDSVIVGPGSAGLLWQIAQAYLDATTHLVAPSPSFEGYPLVARVCGCEITEVPLRDHVADVDAMKAAIRDNTRVVVIAEPNNPTGTTVGDAAIAALVEATRGRSLLVLDEAYLEFASTASVATSHALDEEHVVVLRTFSKAHGLAALRVGYAIGNPQTLSYIDRVGAPFSVSSLAETAAITSLNNTAELDRRVTEITSERDRVVDTLRRHGWPVTDSAANFVYLPIADAAAPLASELERAGVITRPIAGHGLRITIGTPADNDAALGALLEATPPTDRPE